MKITKQQAVELFAALGMQNADKWTASRLASKLNRLDELVEEGTVLPNKSANNLLTAIMRAVVANEPIEVTREETDHPPKAAILVRTETATITAPVKTKDAPVAANVAAPKKQSNTQTQKPTKAADEREVVSPKNAEKLGALGVRVAKTRSYIAGVIIRQHGIDAGVTQAMVDELDIGYGVKNQIESMYILRKAWHAIRGFQTKQ